MAKNQTNKAKLLEEVKTLSEGRLKVLADFAAFLREREEWEATAEILGDQELVKQIKHSREAWAEGKRNEFLTLKELKKKLSV
jgi:hypothetical protein